MAKDEKKPQSVVKRIRRLCADWLESHPDARQPVAKMLRLLDELDDGLAAAPGSPAKGSHKEPGKRRYRGARYEVEDGVNGPVLVERREGDTASFKVPKSVYDGVADVIAASGSALRFEDIYEQVSSRGSAAPGEFQVRATLRFWSSSEPPLIERIRGKYHPANPKSFTSLTKAAWKVLAESSA